MKRLTLIIGALFCILTINAQSVADELLKLKSLMDKGVLTKQEFNEQKKKLLEQPSENGQKNITKKEQNVDAEIKPNSNRSATANFQDPEYSLRPYILTKENVLENLERVDAKVDIKLKGLGYGGTESFYTVFSPKSSSRFTIDNLPTMVIKVDGNTDPSESVILAKTAEVKKDRRRFLLSKMSMTGKSGNTSDKSIKLEFKRLRSGVYQIVLPTNLQSGEYAFMPMGSSSENTTTKVTCFAID